jgi:hypothetical protein
VKNLRNILFAEIKIDNNEFASKIRKQLAARKARKDF